MHVQLGLAASSQKEGYSRRTPLGGSDTAKGAVSGRHGEVLGDLVQSAKSQPTDIQPKPFSCQAKPPAKRGGRGNDPPPIGRACIPDIR